jgi:uncharacterized phage protein gp47/JayE
MATSPSVKNTTTLYNEFRERMETRTGITNYGPDSAARSLIDAVIAEIYRDKQDTRAAFLASQIPTATGRDLDAIGQSLGVGQYNRLEATRATVDSSERNLAFYTETDFGTINGGAAIPIPAGTVIRVRATPAGQTPIEYETTAAVTLPATSKLAYISAQARSIGASQNVGAMSLIEHNFTGYTDVANNSLKITNYFPVLNGRNVEDDKLYRYRLANAFKTLSSHNAIRAKLMGLEVPGVVNISVVKGYYGIGTACIFVFGADGESNTDLVRAVQRRVDTIQIPGLKLYVSAGIRVYVDIDMNVVTNREITDAQQRSYEAGIKRAIATYLGDAEAREVVDLEELRLRVLENTQGLVGIMKNKDQSLMFSNTYIRRGFTTAFSASERERLIVNSHTLLEGEFASLGELTVTFEVRA